MLNQRPMQALVTLVEKGVFMFAFRSAWLLILGAAVVMHHTAAAQEPPVSVQQVIESRVPPGPK